MQGWGRLSEFNIQHSTFIIPPSADRGQTVDLEAKGLPHTSPGQRPGEKVKDRSQAEGLLHMGGMSFGRMMRQPFRLRDLLGGVTQGVALG